jgi:hypothetical protein
VKCACYIKKRVDIYFYIIILTRNFFHFTHPKVNHCKKPVNVVFIDGDDELVELEHVHSFLEPAARGTPAVAVREKLSRQFVDEDGNLYTTATVRAAATSIILADLLDILMHPCLSFGVDGGGEGEGGGTIQAQKEAAGQTKTV